MSINKNADKDKVTPVKERVLSMETAKTLPEKFRKGNKSFIAKIADSPREVKMSSFGAFPKDVRFASLDKDEDVVLIVRRHPAIFWTRYLAVLAVLFSPIMFFFILDVLKINTSSVIALGISGSIIALLFAMSIAMDTFVKWYFSVNIITTQRIIDVDFVSVLYHRFSETQLEKIEDVTHKVGGILGSMFDFGSIYIQTAASLPEFEFEDVPRPRDVQDTILDLLEMKQKGEI